MHARHTHTHTHTRAHTPSFHKHTEGRHTKPPGTLHNHTHSCTFWLVLRTVFFLFWGACTTAYSCPCPHFGLAARPHHPPTHAHTTHKSACVVFYSLCNCVFWLPS
mmetsp:Transcript_28872/g.72678  ORF Transcript_28872/g.72678 Transcript_28872/m.72678 type:complete len:106 (-) Transcript_28872:2193-2510(-)